MNRSHRLFLYTVSNGSALQWDSEASLTHRCLSCLGEFGQRQHLAPGRAVLHCVICVSERTRQSLVPRRALPLGSLVSSWLFVPPCDLLPLALFSTLTKMQGGCQTQADVSGDFSVDR